MGATTLNDHMPASHRRYAEVTPIGLRERASRSAPPPRSLSTSSSATAPTRSRASAPAWASCGSRAATARSGWRPPALRALEINARTLTSVKSILQNRLEGRRPDRPPEAPPITHANIRGPRFFH